MEASEEFKDAVAAYLVIHDEIDRAAKKAKELRKQKTLLEANILSWMKKNNADECELPDGKLERKTSKRTETMKKDYVLEELSRLTGGNASEAEACLNNIMSKRKIITSERLARTTFK